jgi:hypothetical protein
MPNFIDIKMSDKSLDHKKLSLLKWTTTVAIIGVPIMAQILGAMIMFSADMPILLSKSAIILFVLISLSVFLSGIYVCINRIHLRFLGFNKGLDEWEKAIQMKAKAFSYQVIFFCIFVLFLFVSILGLVAALGIISWDHTRFGISLSVNPLFASGFIVALFYIIMFLPTLHMVWNIKPITTEH